MPGEVQQIGAAMQLLIQDETLRLSLGKAARETAESLDIKSFWGRLANIYTSVLASDLPPQRERLSVEALD
jgi:glycosyltransferase involved in cell wall biosynthesis